MKDYNWNKLQDKDSEEFDEEFDEEGFKGFRTIEEIYAFEDFDEEDDMILPNSYLAEFIYILFVIKDIIKNPKRRKWKFNRLITQIYMHRKWMKVK